MNFLSLCKETYKFREDYGTDCSDIAAAGFVRASFCSGACSSQLLCISFKCDTSCAVGFSHNLAVEKMQEIIACRLHADSVSNLLGYRSAACFFTCSRIDRNEMADTDMAILLCCFRKEYKFICAVNSYKSPLNACAVCPY